MPVTPPRAEEGADGLGELLGFEVLEAGDERARGRLEIGARTPAGIGGVSGGLYALLAESLALRALAADPPEGEVAAASGSSNHTSVVATVTVGSLHASAQRRHRGRSTQVWTVDFSDGEGHLCAVSRVTLSLRPSPRGGEDGATAGGCGEGRGSGS